MLVSTPPPPLPPQDFQCVSKVGGPLSRRYTGFQWFTMPSSRCCLLPIKPEIARQNRLEDRSPRGRESCNYHDISLHARAVQMFMDYSSQHGQWPRLVGTVVPKHLEDCSFVGEPQRPVGSTCWIHLGPIVSPTTAEPTCLVHREVKT